MPSVQPTALPPAGHYPAPDHHRKQVVDRAWDGQVWLDDVQPAAEGATLPKYHHHVLGFLRHVKLLAAFIVCFGGAIALWSTDRHAHWVSGAQLALPVLSGLATVTVMLALLLFIGRRVGFDRIAPEARTQIIRWGLLAAVVGFAFALLIELGLPELLGGDPKDRGWSALAGPAEETGKLLIPVILWLTGRFRVPREGYLLVLVSACAFGVLESFEYALNPDHWQVQRPVMEILHPLLTGFAAAVIWQVAWRRHELFTRAAIGAWVIAMVAHSTNDVIVLDNDKGHVTNALGVVTLVVVIGMYLAQKHNARQLVPPDHVGAVSPRWRPAAPRHATDAVQARHPAPAAPQATLAGS